MRKIIFVLFAATVFLTPLIILPLTIDYYHPPKELFAQLAILFCLMLWLIKAARDGKLDIFRTKFYIPLILFCVISGLSLIWAGSRYLGLKDYIQLLAYIGAFFICVNIVGRQREALLVAELAFIAGLISAIYAVLEYFGFDFIRYPKVDFPDWRFRLYSTFGNPDFLANYLILIFPIGLAFYLSAKKPLKKILLVLALAVIYCALIVTFSVGALLGLFLAIIFASALFIFERIRLKNLACREDPSPPIGINIIALLLILALVSLSFPSILNQAKSSIAWRYGLYNRLMSYRAAYRMVRNGPLLGVGIGNFKLRFPEYRGRVLGAQQKYFDSLILDKERDKHVHNDLLQIWVETGLFGFIVFLLILLIMFKNGVYLYFDLFDYKRKIFVLGLISGIIAFLVHSLLSFPMHLMPNGLLFWIFVGLLFNQLPSRDTITINLNIGPVQKRFFETGILIAALLLCIWPIKIYLSEVFLKRMVGLDRQGLIKEAYVEAKTSLFFDPDSNAVVYVGNYANLTKDYRTSAQSFMKVLRNNDEIGYHIALAEIYYKDGLPRDCIKEYLKALFLNPCSTPMHLRLAELYAEYKMYNEAEVECQFLLMHNPDNENIKKRLTSILNRIFEERFLSTYYGEVQANK